MTEPRTEPRSTRARRFLDAVQYAVAITLLTTVALLPITLVPTVGLAGVKYGLFVVATLVMGYATFLGWPSEPADLIKEGGRSSTRFQRLVNRFPPVAWYPILPDYRFPPWIKLYLASFLLFATSFLMEALLGATAT